MTTHRAENENENNVEITDLHGRCYAKLRECRQVIRSQLESTTGAIKPVVFNDSLLHEIALALPQTVPDFKSIKGVDASTFDKHGKKFLEITRQYADELEILREKISSKPPISR
ncbi:hypothetical protein BC830DRAFT_940348 [Chytriomyces sp. MP71]|nr:hypothetical protein BC830DRAFT_940348 [Chytriomyces sp. MP71]